jgi:hypothetical protein
VCNDEIVALSGIIPHGGGGIGNLEHVLGVHQLHGALPAHVGLNGFQGLPHGWLNAVSVVALGIMTAIRNGSSVPAELSSASPAAHSIPAIRESDRTRIANRFVFIYISPCK